MKQRFEYKLTGYVHSNGGGEAALNAIAADGWRIASVNGDGLILWERPFGGDSAVQTEG